MNRRVRKKLDMAMRVRDFSRANPAADAGYLLVVDRLDDAISRMVALVGQQEAGFGLKHSASQRRLALRRRLHGMLLRHLATTAAAAAAEAPDLRPFGLPPANATNSTYQLFARSMLEWGRTHQELLARHGLADQLLHDLEAAVNDFEVTVADTNQATQDHVLARAGLNRLAAEVTQLVEMLDGFNRYRLEREPGLLAAWKSAKHVVAESHPFTNGGDRS
jgi:hypothetical protein